MAAFEYNLMYQRHKGYLSRGLATWFSIDTPHKFRKASCPVTFANSGADMANFTTPLTQGAV